MQYNLYMIITDTYPLLTH